MLWKVGFSEGYRQALLFVLISHVEFHDNALEASADAESALNMDTTLNNLTT